MTLCFFFLSFTLLVKRTVGKHHTCTYWNLSTWKWSCHFQWIFVSEKIKLIRTFGHQQLGKNFSAMAKNQINKKVFASVNWNAFIIGHLLYNNGKTSTRWGEWNHLQLSLKKLKNKHSFSWSLLQNPWQNIQGTQEKYLAADLNNLYKLIKFIVFKK